MSDIVKHLRQADVSMKLPNGEIGLVNHVAADEIERLRKIIKEYETTFKPPYTTLSQRKSI